MERFSNNSLASMELIFHWRDGECVFEEKYIARRVNVWRDIFPEGLAESLMGLTVGESAYCEYNPGEVISQSCTSCARTLPRRNFIPRVVAGHRIEPRAGRFYPQGMLACLPGVYPQTVTPFRILGLEADSIHADFSHPLTCHTLRIEARILDIEQKLTETGGRLVHWVEEVANWGPGMQAALPNRPTDFFDPSLMVRRDAEPDSVFYESSRIVSHVDGQASKNLEQEYRRHLRSGMKVLDLMSSVQSHLPGDMDLQVTGLGLNAAEMERNPLLTDHIVHDLNVSPEIPGEQGSYDAAVCSLSFEYLTDPVAVLTSVRNLLRPGGSVLIGVSNRWFPTKVVSGWLEMHEFERMGYMLEAARRAGFSTGFGGVSVRNDWRPADDPHFVTTRGVSDPVFVVHARKG